MQGEMNDYRKNDVIPGVNGESITNNICSQLKINPIQNLRFLRDCLIPAISQVIVVPFLVFQESAIVEAYENNHSI